MNENADPKRAFVGYNFLAGGLFSATTHNFYLELRWIAGDDAKLGTQIRALLDICPSFATVYGSSQPFTQIIFRKWALRKHEQ